MFDWFLFWAWEGFIQYMFRSLCFCRVLHVSGSGVLCYGSRVHVPP